MAIAGAVIGVLLIVLAAALPFLVDVRKYRPELEAAAAEALGRPVSVGDDLRLGIWPRLELSASDIRIGNPEGFSAPHLLTVKSVDFGLQLWPLVRGRMQIDEIRFVSPHIILEKMADGRVNWNFPVTDRGRAATPEPPPSDSPVAALDEMEIKGILVTDGRVEYKDHQSGQHRAVEELALDMNDISLDRPVAFRLSALLDGVRFFSKGRIGPLGNPPGSGRLEIDLEAGMEKLLEIAVSGHASGLTGQPEIDLDVQIPPFRPEPLLDTLKIPVPPSPAVQDMLHEPDGLLHRIGFSGRFSGKESILDVTDAKLTLGPLSLQCALHADSGNKNGKLHISARTRKEPLELTTRISREKNGAYPLQLHAAGPGQLDLKAKGRVTGGKNPGGDFRIDLAPFSPKTLVSALGLPWPLALADPKALSTAGFSGRVIASRDGLHLKDGRMQVDDTRMTCTAKIKTSPHKDIQASLSLDHMDLDHYLPPTSPAAAGNTESANLSAKNGDRIASLRKALEKTVLDLRFQADAVTVKGIKARQVRMKLAGKNHQFRLSPASLEACDGRIQTDLRMDLQKVSPAWDLRSTVSGVRTQDLLQAFLDSTPFKGIMDGDILLRASGDVPAVLTRTLNGKAEIKVKDGEITGMNLVSMAQNLAASYQGEKGNATRFSRLTAGCRISDGLVRLENTVIQSPLLKAGATGTVDLPAETLDIDITPEFLAPADGADMTGFMVPVRITGTISSPVIRPDVQRMIRMVPRETMEKILKNPEQELGNLLDRQKNKLKHILGSGKDGDSGAGSGSGSDSDSGSGEGGDNPPGSDASSPGEEEPKEEKAAGQIVNDLLKLIK